MEQHPDRDHAIAHAREQIAKAGLDDHAIAVASWTSNIGRWGDSVIGIGFHGGLVAIHTVGIVAGAGRHGGVFSHPDAGDYQTSHVEITYLHPTRLVTHYNPATGNRAVTIDVPGAPVRVDISDQLFGELTCAIAQR